MATLAELTRQHTAMDREDLNHLQRLVGDWGMLADFCFADLLLYAPTTDGRWIVLGQVRPATNQTLYLADWVGAWANESERPLLADVWQRGGSGESEVQVEGLPDVAHMRAIPVRRNDKLLAVLTREWGSRSGRQPAGSGAQGCYR